MQWKAAAGLALAATLTTAGAAANDAGLSPSTDPLASPPSWFLMLRSADPLPPLTIPAAVNLNLEPRWPRHRHTLKTGAIVSGFYALAFVVGWHLPEDVTHWRKEDAWERFRRNITSTPVTDHDGFFVNWVLHPWWGMWVYQSERNYDESIWRSFLVATLHSLTFEYLVEAWTETPSRQDLLSTSPVGALLGELAHRWIRRAGQDGFSFWERLVIDALNPAYRWQIGFDRPVKPVR